MIRTGIPQVKKGGRDVRAAAGSPSCGNAGFRPAASDRVRRRQLEESVSWTGCERLKCLWYRLRLTIAEMNYATRRMTELQMGLSQPPARPDRPSS